MTSRIQLLLKERQGDGIDYERLIKNHPRIVEKDVNCIISPDSDGLLCGLLMSYTLNWKIKGFYDGKILILERGLSAKDCVFLDMEIFRKDIKSFGHHMLLFNKNSKPSNWNNFQNCIQPNNLREYDGLHDFRLKYPLATIHMLLGILGHHLKINILEDAIAPLFFTDGTFNVLFKYPENVLNWLNYLISNEYNSPLNTIFKSEKYSVYNLMLEMDNFFRERDKISVSKERGDRLRISEKNGSPYNLEIVDGYYFLKKEAVKRIKDFIMILSKFTGWEFKKENWLWENFDLSKFTKSDFKGNNKRINTRNYAELLNKNPLSWAMTSGDNIEYTLEEPDKLP
ncbi:hypothetical protein HYV49_04110 [Candidatus Pacearchaeota archaeon]|nr:hypothetical protein [Candidatus Pacearchaeota archaeon]